MKIKKIKRRFFKVTKLVGYDNYRIEVFCVGWLKAYWKPLPDDDILVNPFNWELDYNNYFTSKKAVVDCLQKLLLQQEERLITQEDVRVDVAFGNRPGNIWPPT